MQRHELQIGYVMIVDLNGISWKSGVSPRKIGISWRYIIPIVGDITKYIPQPTVHEFGVSENGGWTPKKKMHFHREHDDELGDFGGYPMYKANWRKYLVPSLGHVFDIENMPIGDYRNPLGESISNSSYKGRIQGYELKWFSLQMLLLHVK